MIKLIFGDCLKIMDKLIKKNIKVDAIIADIPYGVTACKWDSIIPLSKMWMRLKELRKDNGAIVLFGNEPFSSNLRMSNIKEYKYDWIWNKKRPTGMALVKKQPMRQHENIVVFYAKQCMYNRQFTKKDIKNQRPNRVKNSIKNPYSASDINNITPKFSKEFDDTLKNPTTILEYCKSNYPKSLHPTQKPVALMEYLIKTYTNEGDTVLDFTMGSGTTGVACKNLNRSFIGIDNNKKYFDIAKDRIK